MLVNFLVFWERERKELASKDIDVWANGGSGMGSYRGWDVSVCSFDSRP